MALGTEWCAIAEVQPLIAEPYPDDSEITAAITSATSALEASFCYIPLDEDPEDTFPDDWKVRQACAILAAQLLTASTPAAGGADDGSTVVSESIGGYSYRSSSPGKTTFTALRIDGHVKELVGGYLCDGDLGMFSLETIKTRHDYETELTEA